MNVKPTNIDKIATSVANHINNSPKTQKILEAINKNNSLYSGVVSFALAGVLRPLAIGLFPFKDKMDKQTSQISAISAGLVELGFTTAIFIPLNKCIEKASKNLYKQKGSFFCENNVALRSFKSSTNRMLGLIALFPMSFLRFSLIKPILDTVHQISTHISSHKNSEFHNLNNQTKGLNKWV